MSLKLKSGFTFDYDNLYGEGKVTEADLKSYEEDLKKAHEAMKVMRETGFRPGFRECASLEGRRTGEGTVLSDAVR